MKSIVTLLAQNEFGDTGGGGVGIFLIVYLAVIVLYIAAMWRVFTKAGQPGWAALIPIYNLYILAKVAGRPGWWWLLMLIPLVMIIILLIVSIDVAKNFGKGTGFGLGLFFLSLIFYPILAWGQATYQPSVTTS